MKNPAALCGIAVEGGLIVQAPLFFVASLEVHKQQDERLQLCGGSFQHRLEAVVLGHLQDFLGGIRQENAGEAQMPPELSDIPRFELSHDQRHLEMLIENRVGRWRDFERAHASELAEDDLVGAVVVTEPIWVLRILHYFALGHQKRQMRPDACDAEQLAQFPFQFRNGLLQFSPLTFADLECAPGVPVRLSFALEVAFEPFNHFKGIAVVTSEAIEVGLVGLFLLGVPPGANRAVRTGFSLPFGRETWKVFCHVSSFRNVSLYSRKRISPTMESQGFEAILIF
jgi:hypothetical protein